MSEEVKPVVIDVLGKNGKRLKKKGKKLKKNKEENEVLVDDLEKKVEEFKSIVNNNLKKRTLGRIINEYQTRKATDNEEEPQATDNNEEEPQGENRILVREQEEKIAEYINETLKRIIKGENMLDDMKSFMDFVRILPQNMLDENIEYYATVLSNATINGVKLFDDINAARDFINDVRKKRRSRKWLRPKAQKQIKQEIQKNLQISPMMLKNVKHRTNAINIYQY